MADDHEPALLQETCTRKPLPEHVTGPLSSTACFRQHQACLQQLQNQCGSAERCVVVGDPVQPTEQLEQHREREEASASRGQTVHRIVCGTSPAERRDDLRNDGDDDASGRLASADEPSAREAAGRPAKMDLRKGADGPTLLAPRYLSRDKVDKTSDDGVAVEEEQETGVRISSLRGRAAFSIAATASALRCDSLPSCTTLDKRDPNRFETAGETEKKNEHPQLQAVALPYPQEGLTRLSETRLQSSGPVHQAESHVSSHLQDRTHSDRVGSSEQHDIRGGLLEPPNGDSEVTRGWSASSNGDNDRKTNSEEAGGVEVESEMIMPASCAALTDTSTDVGALCERSHSALTTVSTTARDISRAVHGGARPLSRRWWRRPHGAWEAEGLPGRPSPTVSDNGGFGASAAVDAESEAGEPPTAIPAAAGKGTSATRCSCRSSALPWGEVVNPAGQRPARVRDATGFLCPPPEPPACCFCNSMHELAFPPPPARLVARFIAYVFEPQLHLLQRRLQERTPQEPCRSTPFQCSGGEDEKKTAADTMCTAAKPAQTAESAATHPACKQLCTGGMSTKPCSIACPCAAREKQLGSTKTGALMSPCGECPCSLGVGEEEDEGALLHAELSETSAGAGISAFVSSATCGRDRRAAQMPSWPGAHCTAADAHGARGATTTFSAATVSGQQKRPRSALLALQLKQHLLSLICYMEELPRRYALESADSPAAPLLPASEATPPSSPRACRVVESLERTCSREAQRAARSGSVLLSEDHFAFHIEQLLQAEIVVHPLLPLALQAKCPRLLAAPTETSGEPSRQHANLAEQTSGTADSSLLLAPCPARTGGSTAALTETSNGAAQQVKSFCHGSCYTAEHTRTCRLPAKAPLRLEAGRAPGEPQDRSVGDSGDRRSPVTRDAQPLSPRASGGPPGAVSQCDSESIFLDAQDEVMPETAEDAVLLGAPPVMINYLIVFSPLLVLQALQQMGEVSGGLQSAGCSCAHFGCNRGDVDEHTHTQDSAAAAHGAGQDLRRVMCVGNDVAETRSRTCVTVEQNALVCPSFPFTTKETSSTALGVEGATRSDYACADMMAPASPGPACERKEKKNSRVQQLTTSALGTAVGPTAEGRETPDHGHEASSACVGRVSTAVSAEGDTSTAPGGSGRAACEARITAAGPECSRRGIPCSVVQAELKSALCWANRGLIALFRGSVMPQPASPGSARCLLHPMRPRLHHRSTTAAHGNAHGACLPFSENVTTESLTAALLLLAKVAKQSRSVPSDEVRPRACPHSNCERCRSEALCTAGMHPHYSWRADCHHWKHPSETYTRLPSSAFLPARSSSLPGEGAPVAELESWQQLRNHAPHPQELVADLRVETQPQRKGKALKDGRCTVANVNGEGELEEVSSRTLLSTSTRGEPLDAKVDGLQNNEGRTFASPLLLATSRHDERGSVIDQDGVFSLNLRAQERGAAVFFAPLHYRPHDSHLDTTLDGTQLQVETQPLEERWPGNADALHRGVESDSREALPSPARSDSDLKMPHDSRATATEEAFLERLSLEILAHVNNPDFVAEDDSVDPEWRLWSREGLQGTDGANGTDEDGLQHAGTEASNVSEAVEPNDWMRQVAQLFMYTGVSANAEFPGERFGDASEQEPALLNENEQALTTTPYASQDLQEHAQSVCMQGDFGTGTVAQAFRTSPAATSATEDQVSLENLPIENQRAEDQRASDKSRLLSAIMERKSAAFVKDSGPAEVTPADGAAGRTVPGGGTALGEYSKRSCTTEDIFGRGGQPVQRAIGLCAHTKSACGETTERVARRGVDAFEGGLCAAPTIAAANAYLPVQQTGDTPQEELEKVKCACGRRKGLQSVNVDEAEISGNNCHQHARLEEVCGGRRPSGAVPEVVAQPDAPPRHAAERLATQVALQRPSTYQLSVSERVQVQRSVVSTACKRLHPCSPPSKLAGTERAASNGSGSAKKEHDGGTLDGPENRDGAADSHDTSSAPARSSPDNGILAREDDCEQAGHSGSMAQPQRSSHTAEAPEAGADANIGGCRVKRLSPREGDDRTDPDEHPASLRKTPPRRVAAMTPAGLARDEQALRTREAMSAKAPHAGYGSEGRNGSWPDDDHRASPNRMASCEDIDSGMDTRRPMRGVYFDRTQRSWIGSFYEDRRQIKKRFKIDTYGFLKAKALAVGVRLGYERRMLSAVVSATSCEASPKTDAAADVKHVVVLRKDATSLAEVEGTSGKEEELLESASAEAWTKAETNVTASAQQKGASSAAHEHSRQLTTSPRALDEDGARPGGAIRTMQETHSITLAGRTNPIASDHSITSTKKSPQALSVAGYGAHEMSAAARLEFGFSNAEGSQGSSCGSSCATTSGISNVLWSSGGLAAVSPSKTHAPSERRTDCVRNFQRKTPESKRTEQKCFPSAEDLGSLRPCTGVETDTLQVHVEPANTCASELLIMECGSDVSPTSVACTVAASGRARECLSHAGNPAAARPQTSSQLTAQSEQGEAEKQGDSQDEAKAGSRIGTAERLYTGETMKVHTDKEERLQELARIRQRVAGPEGEGRAERRESGGGIPWLQTSLSHTYACEETVCVPVRSTAQQRVYHFANEESSQGAVQRDFANRARRHSGMLRNGESATEEAASDSPADAFARRLNMTRTVAGATGDNQALLYKELRGRAGPSCVQAMSATAGDVAVGSHETFGVRLTHEVQETTADHEERASTCLAATPVASSRLPENQREEGRPREAGKTSEPLLNFRPGRAPASATLETVSGAHGRYTDRSSACDYGREAEVSGFTFASLQGSSCDSLRSSEYPPECSSTRRPGVLAAAYMCSKRRKRPLHAPSEGDRGASSIHVQDLPLGVFYTSKKHAYCANWYEGKRQLKRYFPICKLGEPEARRLAIAARRDAERRERESRCRTRGGASTQTGYVKHMSFADITDSQYDLPSTSTGTPTPLVPARFVPSGETRACAVQTRQPLATS